MDALDFILSGKHPRKITVWHKTKAKLSGGFVRALNTTLFTTSDCSPFLFSKPKEITFEVFFFSRFCYRVRETKQSRRAAEWPKPSSLSLDFLLFFGFLLQVRLALSHSSCDLLFIDFTRTATGWCFRSPSHVCNNFRSFCRSQLCCAVQANEDASNFGQDLQIVFLHSQRDQPNSLLLENERVPKRI